MQLYIYIRALLLLVLPAREVRSRAERSVEGAAAALPAPSAVMVEDVMIDPQVPTKRMGSLGHTRTGAGDKRGWALRP